MRVSNERLNKLRNFKIDGWLEPSEARALVLDLLDARQRIAELEGPDTAYACGERKIISLLAAANLRINEQRERIAELQADAERLDAIEAFKHEYGCWEIQTDATPIIWLSSSVRSSDAERHKRTLRQVIDNFIAAQRQKAGE